MMREISDKVRSGLLMFLCQGVLVAAPVAAIAGRVIGATPVAVILGLLIFSLLRVAADGIDPEFYRRYTSGLYFGSSRIYTINSQNQHLCQVHITEADQRGEYFKSCTVGQCCKMPALDRRLDPPDTVEVELRGHVLSASSMFRSLSPRRTGDCRVPDK